MKKLALFLLLAVSAVAQSISGNGQISGNGVAGPPAPVALSIVTSSLPAATIQSPYSNTVVATGGVPPYTFSLTAGSLPPGLGTIGVNSGAITGTPTALGTCPGGNFTVQVTDSAGPPASASATLCIAVQSIPFSITTTSLPNGTQGTIYSQTIQTSGGVAPVSCSVISGSLPHALTLGGTGNCTLSGTPDTPNVTSAFTIQATDSQPVSVSQGYSIFIVANTPPPPGTSAILPQRWVDPHQCDPPAVPGGGNPWDQTISIPSGVTTPSLAGTYSCTSGTLGSCIGAINNALNKWATSADQWWHVLVDPGTLANGNAGTDILFPVKNGATKCIVVESSAPAPEGQIPCARGITDGQDGVPDPFYLNRQCLFPNDVNNMWTLRMDTPGGPAGFHLIDSVDGANHIVIKDAELTVLRGSNPGLGTNNAPIMVQIRGNNIGLERNYCHGFDPGDLGVADADSIGNCFKVDGSNFWMKDNLCDRVHETNGESHCMGGGGDPGPWDIRHNVYNGGSESLIVGGFNIIATDGVLSDVYFGRNRFTKDLSWRALTGSQKIDPAPPIGCGGNTPSCSQHWSLKNSFELKFCSRCRLRGNVIENMWPDGQTGSIAQLTSRSCSGGQTCSNVDANGVPLTVLSDLSLDHNIWRNASEGINTSARSGGPPGSGGGFSQGGSRWAWNNNLMYNIGDQTQFGGSSTPNMIAFGGGGQQWLGGPNISYTGTETTDTLTITSTTLTLTSATGVDSHTVDLTTAPNNTLSGLITTLSGFSHYTATLDAGVDSTTNSNQLTAVSNYDLKTGSPYQNRNFPACTVSRTSGVATFVCGNIGPGLSQTAISQGDLFKSTGCTGGTQPGTYNTPTPTIGNPLSCALGSNLQANKYCSVGDSCNFGGTDGPANLPTAGVYTGRDGMPSPGSTVTVTAGNCTDLQNKINAASCGQTIVVPAAVAGVQQSYSCQVTIPATACNINNWITLRTDQIANIPESTQVNPSFVGDPQLPGRPPYPQQSNGILLPKIIATTAGGSGVLTVTSGASFWHLFGFEITDTPGTENLSGLVQVPPGADHIVVDDFLVHPEDTSNGMSPGRVCGGGTRACTEEVGVDLEGTYSAVQNSFIYDIRRVQTIAADAKGIFLGNGSAGPRKLFNNFVEASDENIFSGGGAATVVSSNLEIRNNTTYKPLFWKSNDPSYDGNNYEVKNCFELKNATLVLAEGNRFLFNWTGQGDQDGSCILVTPKNPNLTCNICEVSHYTLRYNYAQHAAKAFQLAPVAASQCSTPPCLPAGLYSGSVHDNVFDDISCAWTSNPGGTGSNCAAATKILSDISNFHDWSIDHNTFILTSTVSGATGSLASVTGDVTGVTWNNFTFTNNLVVGGIKGQPVGGGNLGQCGGPGQCSGGSNPGAQCTPSGGECLGGGTCGNFTGQGAASYVNLGELSGIGCFTYTPSNHGWCMDGNGFLTSQANFSNKNSPYPGISTHPSPNCALPLVGNFTTTDYTTVGFFNYNNGSGGDYHLSNTSPFYRKGTDGKDIGANVDLVNSTTGVSLGSANSCAISPTVQNSLTIYALSPGTDDNSGTHCSVENHTGWQNYFDVKHNTIAAPAAWSIVESGDTPYVFEQSRNVTLKDNMITGVNTGASSLGIACTGQPNPTEGRNGQICWNAATLVMDHNNFGSRPGSLYDHYGTSTFCPLQGSAGNCFTTNSFCTTSDQTGADRDGHGDGLCPGFTGFMSGAVWPPSNFFSPPYGSFDYHSLKILPGTTYAAGGIDQASDNTDMGVDFNALDNTLTEDTPPCETNCTNGGANHGPYSFGPKLGIFMVPSGGDNTHNCTKSQPCDSIAYARAQVLTMPVGFKNVWLRGGTYPATTTIAFTSADSGTSTDPVSWNCYPGESCIFSGLKKVSGITAGTSCGTGCQEYDVSLNMSTWKYTQTMFYNGVRRPRPQAASGTAHGYYVNACPQSPTNDSNLCKAGANISAADTACGCPTAVTSAGGHCAGRQTQICGGATPWQCYNVYEANPGDVSASWHALNVGDPEFLLFEDWDMARMRPFSISSGLVNWTGSTAQSNNHGCQGGHMFIVDNVREFAKAGQFYFDRCPTNSCSGTPSAPVYESTAVLRIYADTTKNERPDLDDVELPQGDPASPPLMTWTNVQWQRWRNIQFIGDNWTLPSTGLGDQQGMPNVPGALSVTTTVTTNCSGANTTSNPCMLFDGITVAHTMGGGIDFQGTNTFTKVVNSRLYDLGAFGIRYGTSVVGSFAAQQSDTDNNVPNHNVVTNNEISYGGRIQPTGIGSGILLGDGHHNDFSHNDIHDFYAGLIGMCFGLKAGADDGSTSNQFFCHDNTVTYNKLHDSLNAILDDHGGIYGATSNSASCPAGTPLSGAPCNLIDHNYIFNIFNNYDLSQSFGNSGARGIYLDQGSSRNKISNNLVARTGHSSIFNNQPQINGPNHFNRQDNWWTNNVFILPGYANPAFAFKKGGVIARTGENQGAFNFDHNLSYVNTTPTTTLNQILGGGWGCFGAFYVQYNGATATTTITITATQLTLTDSTSHVITLTGQTLAQVVASINAIANYKAGNTADVASQAATSLVPVSNVNIFQTLYADQSFARQCIDFFAMDHNSWFSSATGNPQEFATCKTAASCSAPFNGTNFNIFTATGAIPSLWQAPWLANGTQAGEDTASVTRDPGFTSILNSDWHMSASFADIGFVPFDYTQAGRYSQGGLVTPTNIPDLFPPRLVNPASDF